MVLVYLASSLVSYLPTGTLLRVLTHVQIPRGKGRKKNAETESRNEYKLLYARTYVCTHVTVEHVELMLKKVGPYEMFCLESLSLSYCSTQIKK